VADGLERLVERRAVEKLYYADGSLWSDDAATAAEIGGWTGWIPVVGEMRDLAIELEAWAEETAAGFANVVLCGMGGSSLAPLVFRDAFGGRLHVLDTTDPDAVAAVEVEDSLFVIASKSGSTLEPEIMEEHFWARTGGDGSRFVAITDPGSKLAARAAERGFRRTFLNRPDIGGRFSALSYFGLVPAALSGTASLPPLLDSALAVLQRSGPDTDPQENEPLKLGALLGDSVAAGRDKLTIITDPAVGSIGLWLEQLLAESTGKDGTGVVPCADEPIGPPDVYGDDRLFAYLRRDGTHDATVDAFEAAGFPVVRCQLAGLQDIAAQMITWELATAYCGALLGINPFDQPNVQAAKDYVVAALQGYERTGRLDDVEPGDLREALAGAKRGRSFFVIQAYVTPTGANEGELQGLRRAVRDRLGVATQLGFGPRYLHSTGQLHKGGSRQGIYLQVVAGSDSDTDIPGRPYGFRTVIEAQSRGDAQALRATGWPVARRACASPRLCASITVRNPYGRPGISASESEPATTCR
jgi:glucose-6-phosphate isomerase